MRPLFVAALAFGMAAPAAAQAGRLAPQQATSSWTVRRDSAGYLVQTFVNRTFSFLPGQDLLFEQVIRTQYGPWEGDKGRVQIVAWAANKAGTAYPRRLWSAEADGAEARLREDRYEVLEFGCCGAWDTRTWLSLETGRTFAILTEGPAHVWWQQGATYDGFDIVYLSDWGTRRSPAMQADSLVWGDLVMLSGERILSRTTLRWTQRKDADAPSHMSVVVGPDSITSGDLELRPGTSAVVRITSDQGVITIPIAGHSFTLAGAVLPPSVTAKVEDGSRPVSDR